VIFTIINSNQRKNESQIEGFSAPPLSVDDFGARKFKAGDKVRLKISNGGFTYFFGCDMAEKITVVASDGNDVELLK
jgi:FtsP/CotA-like multicopper oxidase with cupredoxin domain